MAFWKLLILVEVKSIFRNSFVNLHIDPTRYICLYVQYAQFVFLYNRWTLHVCRPQARCGRHSSRAWCQSSPEWCDSANNSLVSYTPQFILVLFSSTFELAKKKFNCSYDYNLLTHICEKIHLKEQ